MATLTELQKERISFHLDYCSARYLLQITQDNILLTINDSQKLALVGQDIDDLLPASIFSFEGIPLCSTTSALGKVERAFATLDPTTIEDSLYVSQAGSVSLRGTELKKREDLYLAMVKYLTQLIGEPGQKSRVGW
jgi:hypothetical protein